MIPADFLERCRLLALEAQEMKLPFLLVALDEKIEVSHSFASICTQRALQLALDWIKSVTCPKSEVQQ